MILKKTEEAFWKITPREFDSLMRVHVYVNDPKSKKLNNRPTGFIDQVL